MHTCTLPSHLFGMDYSCQDLMPHEERLSDSKSKDFLEDVIS